MSSHDKLHKTGGQRKLLACDGGGIRGIIAIEILARVEAETARLFLSNNQPSLTYVEWNN
jgi:patatin-like phospholipase/acyl hydrolase